MPSANFEIEAFFLDGEHGALLCTYLHPRATPVKGGILYLHPFAEEMHKSRRMAALQARQFAATGYAVLQVDLTGCGDSHGDFLDASWDKWLSDAACAHAWLSSKIATPIKLWGLRTGATLAVHLAKDLPEVASLLLWQPVVNGEQFLKQFLRIRTASDMLNGDSSQNNALRARLAAGESLEVGGYCLSAQLANDLGRLKLAESLPRCPVVWLEVGADNSNLPAPAGQRVVEAWRTAGVEVQTRTVAGEPFWVTQEITECAALLDACQP